VEVGLGLYTTKELVMSGMSVTIAIVSIILVVIWIVAGVFITQANVKLHDYKNEDDPYAHPAWTYSFWAAFTTWTLVGIFTILLIAGLLIGGALFATGIGETEVAVTGVAKAAQDGIRTATGAVKPHISKLAIAALVVGVVLATTTGILSAMTAVDVRKIGTYDSDSVLKEAHDEAVKAAVICLTSVGLTVVAGVSYIWYVESKKKKYTEEVKEEKAEAAEKNREFLLQLEQTKQKQS